MSIFHSMVEPFYDATKTSGILHSEMWAQRYKDLREYALGLPKFGTDSADDEVWTLYHTTSPPYLLYIVLSMSLYTYTYL